MTNERKTPDDSTSDELVTQAYRDLANEQAPQRSDDAVLRAAAKALRPPYQRSILWTRPVAWAAVVAICLAITLQVTQVPVPNDVPAIMQMQEAVDYREAPEKTEQESTGRQLLQDAPARSDDQEPALRSRATRPLSPASPEQDLQPVSPEEHFEPALRDQPVLQEATPTMPAEFEMQDADMLQRAEDMVRLQSGDNKESDPAAVGVSAYAPAGASLSLEVPVCNEDDRQDPQDWLACIVRLEQAGLAEEATLERDQLGETFPDFVVPASPE